MGRHFENLCILLQNASDVGYAAGVGFANGFPKLHRFTYPVDFLEQYEKRELSKHDNTLRAGLTSDGIFEWSSLETTLGPSLAMDTAKSFGMMDGICWACTVNGMKSIVSIALSSSAKDATVARDEVMDCLRLATIEASAAVSEDALNSKSLDFLICAARGMSHDDIANELGLSVAGVRKRQRVCLQELGAQNLPHAVALAASFGLIANSRLV